METAPTLHDSANLGLNISKLSNEFDLIFPTQSIYLFHVADFYNIQIRSTTIAMDNQPFRLFWPVKMVMFDGKS